MRIHRRPQVQNKSSPETQQRPLQEQREVDLLLKLELDLELDLESWKEGFLGFCGVSWLVARSSVTSDEVGPPDKVPLWP